MADCVLERPRHTQQRDVHGTGLNVVLELSHLRAQRSYSFTMQLWHVNHRRIRKPECKRRGCLPRDASYSLLFFQVRIIPVFY